MRRCPTQVRPIVLLSLAAGLALAAGIRPAGAQVGGGGMPSIPSANNPQSLVNGPTTIGPSPQIKQPQAAPAALPGAVTRSERVAPAQGPTIADPTEALFDAINRGDMASAKDAIDRGADLEGHNVLGMTPLDLSVDLGRNDITFLLLSLRNGDTGPSRRAVVPAAQTAAAAKPAPGQAKQAARPPGKPPARQAAQVTPAAPVAPRLFAGDGGTPNPAVGFLGFDSRH